MISKLHISNFKSVKNLQLSCKKINLFIGEPNVGKSNILEGLSIFAVQHNLSFDGLVRFNDLSNLFSENDLSNKIVVSCDEMYTEISYEKAHVTINFYKDDQFKRKFITGFQEIELTRQGSSWDFAIHPYFFKPSRNFPILNYEFLSFPHGENLFFLLQTNKALRNLVSEFVQERGFKLTLRQASNEIEISKEEDGILTSYPYTIISDTLQRIIFFIAAIESNKKESTLIFEEPESNVFPYYTKYLAEKIALDLGNQYFLTTHNPYFLLSLIEKTPADNIGVHIVQMNERFETGVVTLTNKGVEEVLRLGSDVFLNMDKLVDA